ncbi:MAG: c-type cytochrome, partial [Pirellulaceae bacterium]|nr:c-type cytochrome [Pirellulaceae bacterium]
MQRIILIIFNLLLFTGVAWNGPQTPIIAQESEAQEGRDLLLNYAFLPRDFHQSTFDQLWKDWPEPLKSQAEQATPAERRQMAYDRFGLSSRQDAPEKPLQYVVDNEGWWSMNCFACHGGKAAGVSYEGLPNAQLALETLYADLRRTKKRLDLPLGPMERGSMVVPMGSTVGTSNAVIFGIALMSYRDKDLNLRPFRFPPVLIHHDMDAPPWWNVKKRERLYIDGFVEKSHRALIPFVMDQRNSGEKMIGWEDEFKKVFAYIESLPAPQYPFDIDQQLAQKGRQVFQNNCAECHGSYGADMDYPSRIIPLDEIGTDPIRLKALSVKHRQGYHESWYANYGKDDIVHEPQGYQAPPLDGVWASAPYLHNGSVPTLWHLLHPE